MSVKFKLSASADKKSVERLLGTLAEQGLKADQLFPKQKRPALARLYVIRSARAQVKIVQRVLKPFDKQVEYVEGAVERKALG